MNETSARKLTVARAYTAAALHVTTQGANFFKVRRHQTDVPSRAELAAAHYAMRNGDGLPAGWFSEVADLMSDIDKVKDLLYSHATSSRPGREKAVESWFRAELDEPVALAATREFLACDGDLLLFAANLGRASTECGFDLPRDFEQMFVACARTSPRVVLPDSSYRSGPLSMHAFDQACILADDLHEAYAVDEYLSDSDASAILGRLANAGVEYATRSRRIRLRSLNQYVARTALKLWYDEGYIPPVGRYFDHVAGLVGYALAQARFCDSAEGIRLGHALRLEYCNAGRLAVRAADSRGDLLEVEASLAQRSLHSIALLCKEIESRGGCPGIVASSSVGDPCGCPSLFQAASRMLAWKSELSSEERAVEGGDVSESEESGFDATVAAVERKSSGSRSYGDLFDE
jgi:hypothetical protein